MPLDQLCFSYVEIICSRQQNEITFCLCYVSGTLDMVHLLIENSLRSVFPLETQNQKLGYPDGICCDRLHQSVWSLCPQSPPYPGITFYPKACRPLMTSCMTSSMVVELKCFQLRLNLVIESRAQDKMSWICLMWIIWAEASKAWKNINGGAFPWLAEIKMVCPLICWDMFSGEIANGGRTEARPGTSLGWFLREGVPSSPAAAE